MKFLEKIRSRSNVEKKIFAFNLALIITAIVFGLWLISKIYSFDDFTLIANSEKADTPFQSLMNGLSSIFKK